MKVGIKTVMSVKDFVGVMICEIPSLVFDYVALIESHPHFERIRMHLADVDRVVIVCRDV